MTDLPHNAATSASAPAADLGLTPAPTTTPVPAPNPAPAATPAPATPASTPDPAAILRDAFGYAAFRPGQQQAVDAILQGRDCVAVMPTGAGKSICYQVPALARHAAGEGLTLVISPLVSLMSDQVSALSAAGIPAACLNSQLAPAERRLTLQLAAASAFALLYVAPERLDDPEFLDFVRTAPIPLVAVDEAHCVSQWGQDFRPSYLAIADFIASLPQRPTVAAFTATATPRVAGDVIRLLDLRSPARIATGFDRPNLRFSVEQLPDKRKLARLAAHALARPAESGIVYCATRKTVEQVHEALLAAGIPATRYHAGLSSSERTANQRAFVTDDAPVMVATNAFGMGIDKSNVRYVVHFNMPGSLEAYYQEAGRAGRDGEPAECILMWNDSDIATARFFIEQDTENGALTPDEAAAVRASQRRRLAAMANYCMTTDCLRATILRYFGESVEGEGESEGESGGENAPRISTDPVLGPEPIPEPASARARASATCGNCSNCTEAIDAVDVTQTARAVMRCVQELRGRFGKGIVADVLTGSKSAKLREYGLDSARTFGTVDDSAGTVKEVIELLVAGEYLEVSEGRYPLVGFGPRYREAADPAFTLRIKRVAKPAKQPVGKGRATAGAPAADQLDDAQRALFERLRQLRKRIADEEGVPPYIVFSDAALRGMAVARPRTDEDFLAISGVGPTKLARYGQAFLQEIAHQE